MKDFYTDQVWPFRSCFCLNQVHAVNLPDSWQVQLSVPEAEKCYCYQRSPGLLMCKSVYLTLFNPCAYMHCKTDKKGRKDYRLAPAHIQGQFQHRLRLFSESAEVS